MNVHGLLDHVCARATGIRRSTRNGVYSPVGMTRFTELVTAQDSDRRAIGRYIAEVEE